MERRNSSRTGTSRTENAPITASEDLGRTSDDTGTHTHSPQSTGLVNTIKERATSQLTMQKDRATEGIGTVAQAVRQTTERLRDEQHDTVAQYVERAAEQLERLSDGLREKDVSQLLHDAQRFVRRQPALFIGGSFVAGMLAARFLKSSREDDGTDYAGQVRGNPADIPSPLSGGGY
jgi:hypothetical protein